MSVTTIAPTHRGQDVDREFDLDLKLAPVARNGSADRPWRPTECSCTECDTSAQTCTACPGQ